MRLGQFNLAMHVLITGGFGFIGGRLAEYLVRSGHQVTLGSRTSINPPAWLKQASVTKINWDDACALKYTCAEVDVIVHAAGMNAQDCAADPSAALAFNGLATARLVDAANRTGVKKFFYLSTAHIYARPLVGNITEETLPCNLHPYASSHLVGEHAVLSANNQSEFQGVVLRLSNCFGVPSHDSVNCWTLLVNDLCRQVIETGKLKLLTNGEQQRDFIGLNKVCYVIEKLSTRQDLSREVKILNLGSGVSYSVISMAELIQKRCIKVFDFEPKIEYEQINCDPAKTQLIYNTAKLAALDIDLSGFKITTEIDNLLRYCKSTYIKFY